MQSACDPQPASTRLQTLGSPSRGHRWKSISKYADALLVMVTLRDPTWVTVGINKTVAVMTIEDERLKTALPVYFKSHKLKGKHPRYAIKMRGAVVRL